MNPTPEEWGKWQAHKSNKEQRLEDHENGIETVEIPIPIIQGRSNFASAEADYLGSLVN